jgi:hypothetical protein
MARAAWLARRFRKPMSVSVIGLPEIWLSTAMSPLAFPLARRGTEAKARLPKQPRLSGFTSGSVRASSMLKERCSRRVWIRTECVSSAESAPGGSGRHKLSAISSDRPVGRKGEWLSSFPPPLGLFPSGTQSSPRTSSSHPPGKGPPGRNPGGTPG